MTDLKTLDAMGYFVTGKGKFEDDGEVVTFTPHEFVDKNGLRQEAIKWIKWIRAEVTKNCKNNELTVIDGDINKVINCETYEMDCVVNWIKHFFNITEEDLK